MAPSPRSRVLAVLLVGAACVAAGGLAAALKPARTANAPDALARSYAEAGDFRRAAETRLAAYRAAPSERLRLEAARAQMLAGDNPAAVDMLGAISSDAASDYARRHLLAEAMLRLKRYDEAYEISGKLLAQAPADARARLLQARIAYGLGDFAGAKAALAVAIRTGGEALGDAWLFRARIALHENELEAARSAAERASAAGAPPTELRAVALEAQIRQGRSMAGEIKPGSTTDESASQMSKPQRAYLAAFEFAHRGEYAEAARLLRDIEPWVMALPYGDLFIARVQMLAGDVAQGETGFESAIRDAPHNALLQAAKVDRLIATGRLVDADEAVQRLESLDQVRGGFARLALTRSASDWDGRIEAVKRVAGSTSPHSVDAFLFGALSAPAKAHAMTRDADLARSIGIALEAPQKTLFVARALAGAGADPGQLVWAGRLFQLANADATAAAAFDRALAAAPNCRLCVVDRIRTDIRSGEPERAEERIITAGAGSRNAPLLARVRAAQGRLAEAAVIMRGIEEPLATTDALFFGEILARLGQTKEIVSLAREMERRETGSLAAAGLAAAAGLYEESAAAARRALLTAPQDSDLADEFASAMLRVGRRDEAIEFLDELGRQSGTSFGAAFDRLFADGAPDAPSDIGDETAIRRAYLFQSSNLRALTRFARALSEQGEAAAALQVRRESCFWGYSRDCLSPENALAATFAATAPAHGKGIAYPIH